MNDVGSATECRGAAYIDRVVLGASSCTGDLDFGNAGGAEDQIAGDLEQPG